MQVGNSNTSGILGEKPATATQKKPGELGKDEFLKLLTTQLGNQDPLNPMDSQAFVAQLAQFSTLELQQSANSQLETLVLAQAASNQVQASTLVGKEVLYKSDTMILGADGQATSMAELKADAAKVTASISDKYGKLVRVVELGGKAAGTLEVPWDGRDSSGVRLPAGEYSVKVTAADVTGKSIDVSSRGKAVVTGVAFQDGVPQLLIGDRRIVMSDVSQVHQPSSPSTTNP